MDGYTTIGGSKTGRSIKYINLTQRNESTKGTEIMKISFWKRDKYVSKKFRNEQKLKKFLDKNQITMFDMNGITYAIIGGTR